MMLIEKLYRWFLDSSGVTTDTRKIVGGELYFALKGEHYDGNTFVTAALNKGCRFVVSDDSSIVQDSANVMIVQDALVALQQLAQYHRKKWNGKILAITGSNGKTTTKELISAVLSGKFNLLSTIGNLNNHIGVPLTLLRIKEEELAVVEMGANHPGEIAALCEIALPDYGIITNVGKAHLEGFGGEKGVEKAKGELYDFLANNKGTAIVNMSVPKLKDMAVARGLHFFSYGLEPELDLSGELSDAAKELQGSFTVGGQSYQLKSDLFGTYNFMNMLTAAAAGVFFEVAPTDISFAIENYHADNNRSQLVNGKTNTLILDAYNANPTSMKLALNDFIGREAVKKMAILGDMHELGTATRKEHEHILQMLHSSNISEVLLVGEYFSQFSGNSQFPFRFFKNIEACTSFLSDMSPSGYLILLKGSRKNALEKASKLLL